MVGPGWKFFVWQLISVFAFKNFYCTFDTQLAENENTFYMFSLGFSYYSKDWWQFCNFLHKLTGGILVIKHTTFLLFSDMFNGHETPFTPNPCSPASPLHRSASFPTPLYLQQPYRHVSTRSISPLLCRSLFQFTLIHCRETPLYDPPPRLSAPSRGSLPPRQPPFRTLLSPPRRRTQRLVRGRPHGGVGWLVLRRPAGSSSRLPWVALNGGSSWLSQGGSHRFETFLVLWLSWLSWVETLSMVWIFMEGMKCWQL